MDQAERRAAARDLLGRGLSKSEIARRLGVNRGTIVLDLDERARERRKERQREAKRERRGFLGRWTNEKIVDAFVRWNDERGEIPRERDWRLSVRGFPSSRTVRAAFGSWAEAVIASGLATPEWRREAARALATRGLSHRRIADRLRVSDTTVARYLSDEARERDRVRNLEWKRANDHGVCETCGGPTSKLPGKAGYARQCQWCRYPHRQRPAPVELRRAERPKLNGHDLSASDLVRTYDCLFYGCTDDALLGEDFCGKHLDVKAGKR